MSDAWESRGTVWLDGKHYHIKDLLGSDSMDGLEMRFWTRELSIMREWG